MANSAASDFSGEEHFTRILPDPPLPDADTRRLVQCSGKVAYDLIKARNAAGIYELEVIGIEQLYPFPGKPLARLALMPRLEDVVRRQEEPRNNGGWIFVERFVEAAMVLTKTKPQRPRYANRAASASPVTDIAKCHQSEQAALVADALGLSVRFEIRRKKNA